MTGLRRQVVLLVLAAAIWTLPAPPAGAHGHGVEPDEVAALGAAHAQEHARARLTEHAARRHWARLTPRQRNARIQAAERQTNALNAGLAGAHDDTGYWEPKLYPLPEYAIHASMLPTGEILIFGREPLVDGSRSNRGSARLFNPQTGQTRHVPPPPIPENPAADGNPMPAAIYCGGQALLSDGRVLVAGGNLSEPAPGKPAYSGLDYTFLFDPWTETWEIGPKMSHGRWYPTLTKLSSGDVLIASGLDENGQGVINPQLDIYRPGADFTTPEGTLEPFPAGERVVSVYPNLFLLPDANVVLAGPDKHDSAVLDTTIAQDRSAAAGSAWSQIPTQPSEFHYGGSSVLEPNMNPATPSWSVLGVGGAGGTGYSDFGANQTVDRLTAGPGPPAWSHDPREDLNQRRFYPNNVLLPDGGMVAIGGGSGTRSSGSTPPGNYYVEDPPPPELKQVELRRPGGLSWRLGAAQQEFRTYHSTAVLLADGRIVSAGDDGHEGPDPDPSKAVQDRRDSAEIYWPPYLFDGDRCSPRPAIRKVGSATPPVAPVLGYGQRFGIFSEHARPGMQAVLVAPAAVTHGVDMNQRVVALAVSSRVTAGGLNAMTPAKPSIAPPGWYMLFVIDADGTPSIARWVRLLPGAAVPPATVTGAWPNPQPRSCVNPDGTTISEPPPLPPPPPPPPPPAPAATKFTAKLGVGHALIKRGSRTLDVLATLSDRASGKVKIELLAGRRRTRFKANIDSARKRVRVLRKISRAQARLGTGIVTITYDGDDDTRPQSVRLRAAPRAARLKMSRPTLTDAGRLRANGTITKRARGVVRVQLEFVHEGQTRTVQLRARIVKGAWKLDEQLSTAVRGQVSQRSGTVHSYTLFTGYERAGIRGEMRSFEVLGAP